VPSEASSRRVSRIPAMGVCCSSRRTLRSGSRDSVRAWSRYLAYRPRGGGDWRQIVVDAVTRRALRPYSTSSEESRLSVTSADLAGCGAAFG